MFWLVLLVVLGAVLCGGLLLLVAGVLLRRSNDRTERWRALLEAHIVRDAVPDDAKSD